LIPNCKLEARIGARRIPIGPTAWRSKFRCKETGGALVEYAFTVIIFLTLMFGISSFGTALYAYHFVNNIAKEAARWAAVNSYNCGAPPLGDNSCNGAWPMNNRPAQLSDVDLFVKNHTPPGIDSTKITTSGCGLDGSAYCTDSTPDACKTGNVNFVAVNSSGCTVQVRVAYAMTFIFPLLPKTAATTAPCTKPGFCLSSESEIIIAH
jgi:hypothetical protein